MPTPTEKFIVWTLELPISDEMEEELKKVLAMDPEDIPEGKDMTAFMQRFLNKSQKLGRSPAISVEVVERFSIKDIGNAIASGKIEL